MSQKITISLEDGTNVSINDIEKKPESEERYIFVRLYDPKYAHAGIGSKALQFGQNITADKRWKVISAHAAIALNLKDAFYGLTIAGGDPTLKVEKCQGAPDNYINANDFDLKTSKYYVYGFKCDVQEYSHARQMIAQSFNTKNVIFDPMFAGVRMTFYSIARKIKQFLFDHEKKKKSGEGSLGVIRKDSYNQPTGEEVTTVKKICSTFVASVLIGSINKLKEYYSQSKHKKESKYVSPSDIASFPGAKRLFSGFYANYTADAKKYAAKHPEFEKYL